MTSQNWTKKWCLSHWLSYNVLGHTGEAARNLGLHFDKCEKIILTTQEALCSGNILQVALWAEQVQREEQRACNVLPTVQRWEQETTSPPEISSKGSLKLSAQSWDLGSGYVCLPWSQIGERKLCFHAYKGGSFLGPHTYLGKGGLGLW